MISTFFIIRLNTLILKVNTIKIFILIDEIIGKFITSYSYLIIL